MNKTRVLFAAYLAAGALSLFVLVASQIPGLAAGLVRTPAKGEQDLDDMANVSVFTDAATDYETGVNAPFEAGIESRIAASAPRGRRRGVLLVGDSFVGGRFRDLLTRKYGIPNAFLNADDGLTAEYLETLKADRSLRAGYLVYESVDRLLFFRFGMQTPGDNAEGSDDPNSGSAPPCEDGGGYGYFDSKALEYLVTRNPLVFRLTGLRNTVRLYAFGDISANTPVYSTSPPMLYYHKSVRFNEERISDQEIRLLADRMRDYSREVEEYTGVKTVFLPVPCKYTVYGFGHGEYSLNGGVAAGYNGFLPRLYRELDKRQVEYIDVYNEFTQSPELLYYPTGTHWNGRGMLIALGGINRWHKRQEKLRASGP